MVHTTGWLKGLRVTADGTGIVLHAGGGADPRRAGRSGQPRRVVLCHQRLGVHGHHRVRKSWSTYATGYSASSSLGDCPLSQEQGIQAQPDCPPVTGHFLPLLRLATLCR
jgi:hypothetical protein